jgi:hypothetical protein
MPQAPIDVETLPPASTFLTYPRQGPPVGKYMGPNTNGEYLTVVSNEAEAGSPAPGQPARHRVGLAYGCYTIDGKPTDPAGLPPDVALSKLQRDWAAMKTPGFIVPERAGRPTRIRPVLGEPVTNDPDASVTITDA